MFLVEGTIKELIGQFELIPDRRRDVIHRIALFIDGRIQTNQTADLVFICTHNSRRSHMAQIWAETAAALFGTAKVRSYSGGTEETAFNPSAVDAMISLGFNITQKTENENPIYAVSFSDKHPSLNVFSKRYDNNSNPASEFAAIMTCTDADENCPVVSGASARFSLPFDDPKAFDGTDLESMKYRERSLEIGREILYLFSQIDEQ